MESGHSFWNDKLWSLEIFKTFALSLIFTEQVIEIFDKQAKDMLIFLWSRLKLLLTLIDQLTILNVWIADFHHCSIAHLLCYCAPLMLLWVVNPPLCLDFTVYNTLQCLQPLTFYPEVIFVNSSTQKCKFCIICFSMPNKNLYIFSHFHLLRMWSVRKDYIWKHCKYVSFAYITVKRLWNNCR